MKEENETYVRNTDTGEIGLLLDRRAYWATVRYPTARFGNRTRATLISYLEVIDESDVPPHSRRRPRG